MNSMRSIIEGLPGYAYDLSKNLESIFRKGEREGLSADQVYLISIVVSYALQNEDLVQLFRTEGARYIGPNDLEVCKSVVAVMVMNNTYYRFTHSVSAPDFADESICLSKHFLHSHKIDTTDLELCMLAVSIVHGCNCCMNHYTKKLLDRGISTKTLKHAAKIVAVVKTLISVLKIEDMRPGLTLHESDL